jgi:hypothetical protein
MTSRFLTWNDIHARIVACAEHNGRDVGDEAHLILLDNMGIDTTAERAGDKPGAPTLPFSAGNGARADYGD